MPEQHCTQGFYFELSFENEQAAFLEVSGIAPATLEQPVAFDGKEGFNFTLPGNHGHQNLVLRKSVLAKSSALVLWCRNCIDTGLFTSISTHNIKLSLLDANSTAVAAWVFHQAYPVKYAGMEFNADEILIETLELAYAYCETLILTR